MYNETRYKRYKKTSNFIKCWKDDIVNCYDCQQPEWKRKINGGKKANLFTNRKENDYKLISRKRTVLTL